MKNPNDKGFIPFFDEDFIIVSPFRSYEENIQSLRAAADISSHQLKLELELLESYSVNGLFDIYNTKKT